MYSVDYLFGVLKVQHFCFMIPYVLRRVIIIVIENIQNKMYSYNVSIRYILSIIQNIREKKFQQ